VLFEAGSDAPTQNYVGCIVQRVSRVLATE
jgi:hypothetical protein